MPRRGRRRDPEALALALASVPPPVQVCPLCAVSWQTRSARCFCGYDFETGNPQAAIARLSAARRSASRTWRFGVLALLLLPVTCAAGASYGDLILPAMLFGLFQLGAGLGLTSRGLLAVHRSRKGLAEAEALRRLPPARVVR